MPYVSCLSPQQCSAATTNQRHTALSLHRAQVCGHPGGSQATLTCVTCVRLCPSHHCRPGQWCSRCSVLSKWIHGSHDAFLDAVSEVALSLLPCSVGQCNAQHKPRFRGTSLFTGRECSLKAKGVVTRMGKRMGAMAGIYHRLRRSMKSTRSLRQFPTCTPCTCPARWVICVLSRLYWWALITTRFLNLSPCEIRSTPDLTPDYPRAFGSDMNYHLVPSIPHCYLVQTSLESSFELKKKQADVPNFVSY